MLIASLVAHTTKENDKLTDPVLASCGFGESALDNEVNLADPTPSNASAVPATNLPPKKKR